MMKIQMTSQVMIRILVIILILIQHLVVILMMTHQKIILMVLIQMTIDEHTLRCDTVALVLDFVCALVNVFKRQAQINCDLLLH